MLSNLRNFFNFRARKPFFSISAGEVKKGLLCRIGVDFLRQFVGEKVMRPAFSFVRLESIYEHLLPNPLSTLFCEECSGNYEPGEQSPRCAALPCEQYVITDDSTDTVEGIQRQGWHEHCLVQLPAHANCVHLTNPDERVGSLREIDTKFVPEVSMARFAALVLGLFLVLCHAPLSKLWIVHWALGGLAGIALVLVLVFYVAYKTTRNTVPGMNAGMFFLTSTFLVFPSTSAMLYYALPYLGFNLSQQGAYDLVTSTFFWLAQYKEPIYGFPLGFLFISGFTVGGILLGNHIFKSPAVDEIKGDVAFHIAGNGARIDHLPEPETPAGQYYLQTALLAIGSLLLMSATIYPLFNVGILGVAYFAGECFLFA